MMQNSHPSTHTTSDAWDDFRRHWPLSRLESMTLDEYTSVGNSHCFVNWLERKLTAFGSIFGGSAFKFGVYARANVDKDGATPKNGGLQDDKYGWYVKHGATAQDAFATVRAAVVRIARAASQGDLETVETDQTFGPVVKWKIAFLYQNRSDPVCPAIFDEGMLARMTGLPAKTPHVDLVRAVMKLRSDNEDVAVFSRRLWTQTTADIVRTVSLETLTEVGGDYSPGITVQDWERLLTESRDVFTVDGLATLRAIAELGGRATCKLLARLFGRHYQYFNATAIGVAKKVHQLTECPLMTRASGEEAYWSILFHGFDLPEKFRAPFAGGGFLWVMRDELREALEAIGLHQLPAVGLKAEDIEPETEDVPLPAQEEKPPYTDELFKEDLFVDSDTLDDLLALLRVRKNVILQGPPGVGKTFISKRLAYRLMELKDDERIGFVQFHQSYGYEDFVAGYRPTAEGGFAVRRGVFFEFCRRAQQRPDVPFVFIIDEINRGNLSKILGELLMLIEPSHRGESLPIACDGSSFSVPENVYLIGMMNTADRSLAMIDYALRRRFSFFTLEPGFETENFKGYENGLGEAFSGLIDVIRDLNKAIADDEGLGKGFCLGHSYFSGLETADAASLRRIVTYDILPTLEEYWFDDSNKVKEWRGRLNGAIDG